MSIGLLNIVQPEKVTIETIPLDLLKGKNIKADVLRLDKIHPVISGNKWYKLKYFLTQAIEEIRRPIISFGGPYSNHIIALACAANNLGLPAVGIIRGERPPKLSQTLQDAGNYGMQLLFASRNEYRLKNETEYLDELGKRFPGALIIPEGGEGPLGVAGSREILSIPDKGLYTHVVCAVGTGTMFCGLVESLMKNQNLTGICVLKGMTGLPHGFKELNKTDNHDRYRVVHDYHFGGYAKKDVTLIGFMNNFFLETGIPTDFVYTAKMFYALTDLVKKDYFPPSSRLLIIHSGGLQGNDSLATGTLHF